MRIRSMFERAAQAASVARGLAAMVSEVFEWNRERRQLVADERRAPALPPAPTRPARKSQPRMDDNPRMDDSASA